MKRLSIAATRRPLILLVQQSHDDGLEMYTEFLRYHGLTVIPVSNAWDAFRLAPPADIVVTAMQLDDPVDGVQLVSRLRHDDCTKSKPIIVLTACASDKDRERAQGAGCDVFLPKPCLPNDLLGEVRQLLAECAQTHARHTARGVTRTVGAPLTSHARAHDALVMTASRNVLEAARRRRPCCTPSL